MMGFCPHCENEVRLRKTSINEEFEIRGEKIVINASYLICQDEGHLFEDPLSEEDSVDLAFREYRKRKNMLQPEQIRDFRTRYGLTQNELNKLLSWGGATLSRYENGSLQSLSHDKLLRLAMQPENLVNLIENNPDAISSPSRERIISTLRSEVMYDCPSLRSHFEDCFSHFEPDEFSGYVRLDVDKLTNAFLFFCRKEPVVKTKMNKLLFYADFMHFRDYGTSITGARYAHLPYGPAPHLYELLLAILRIEDQSIGIEEQKFGDFVGEVCLALRDPDISLFSTSEICVLAEVARHFEEISASKICDLSHKEEGYLNTLNADIISYEYAEDLSIYLLN